MPPYTPLSDTLSAPANLDDTSSWGTIEDFLISHIRIPNLSTPRGLRRAYNEIERIHAELQAFCQLARMRNSPQLLAAVVNILVKLCADSILKEKLCERGLIQNIMDLLEYDLTRDTGLRLLLVFTHDDCRTQGDILEEIARHSGVLTRIVQNHPDDREVTELAVVVLAHVARYVICSVPDTTDRRIEDMGLRDVLLTMLHVLRKPQPSRSLLTHALMSLVTPAQYIPAYCQDNVSLNALFVVLLRANKLTTRATALESILNIQVDPEPDKYDVDLHHLAQALKRAGPPPPTVILASEDCSQSDSSQLYRQSLKYIDAMSQAVRDQDLSALGRSIADIVQRSPSIIEGSWQELEHNVLSNERARAASLTRLPFSLWSDSLPECAKALRLSGAPSDRDAADILDMKYYMIRNRPTEAIALAQETIARNPNHPYAYYVLSLCEDTCEQLRAATKGLRCSIGAPFLRKQLLWRAVESGVWQGFQQILTADDERAQERGAAVLRTAWDHAQTFLAEAAPDAHLRLTMLGWSLLITFALRGSELSQDLSELDHIRREIHETYAVMEFFGYSVRKTRLYKAWNNILDLQDDSLREWGDVVRSCNALNVRMLCSGTGAEHTRHIPGSDEGPVPEVYLGMHRCSRCRALSATLKKCKGCRETYCDTACQKPHWETHKRTCEGRRR
ncbi:hypothetical protein C8T65DRAFT_570557 [Cerioporus squamosus]|nr:hypothetical protein C8T65DRAFT_570557 [Cerioporus squamosus]